MGHSLSAVYLHIIFSTKNREHYITDAVAPRLHGYLRAICTEMECTPLEINGWYDHVHIFCRLSRNCAMKTLLEELKKRSSKWIKTIDTGCRQFYWQRGYASFSVGPDGVDAVRAYIRRQREHHSAAAFKDECRGLFNQHKLDFDERYVWD